MPNAPKTLSQLRRKPIGRRHKAEPRPWDNRRWRKFRKDYLDRNPFCEDCERHGVIGNGLAVEVHHIKKARERPDLMLVESNVVGLCKRHHSRRTSRGE